MSTIPEGLTVVVTGAGCGSDVALAIVMAKAAPFAVTRPRPVTAAILMLGGGAGGLWR